MDFPVVVFADGNRNIGFGHLTRTRTFLQWIGSSGLLITRTPDAARLIYTDCGAQICTVSKSTELRVQIEAQAPGAKLVIVDPPYSADAPLARSGPHWHEAIADLRRSGRAVIFLTDEDVPTDHNCDVLVNDHPKSREFATYYNHGGKIDTLLAGPQHFLIDPSHDIEPAYTGRLFVSFGGGDQLGLIPRFYEALSRLSREIPIDLVVGPGSVMPLDENENIVLHRSLAPGKFAQLLAGCRMALTASGNTLFERAYHGVPGMSIAQSPHQDTLGEGFAELNTTRHIGIGDKIMGEQLIAALRDLWNDQKSLDKQRAAAEAVNIRAGCETMVQVARSFI